MKQLKLCWIKKLLRRWKYMSFILQRSFQGSHLVAEFSNRVKSEETRQVLMFYVEQHRKVVKSYR